jgi:hypothetical protein
MRELAGAMRAIRWWLSPWATATKVAVVIVAPVFVVAGPGASDSTGALTFAGRLEGFIAVLTSLVLLGGAIAALIYQAGAVVAGSLALIGAIVATVTSAILLVLAVTGDRLPGIVIIAAAMLLAGAWATVRVVRSGVTTRYPRSVALAVTIPTLITMVNFIYDDAYQPSVQPRAIDVTAQLGAPVVAADHRSATIPLTITFKNASSHKLYMLGSSYSVIGRQDRRTRQPVSGSSLWSEGPGEQSYTRDRATTGYELLQSGQLSPPGSTVEVGDTVTRKQVVTVDLPTDFDVAEAFATVFLLRADQARVTTSPVLNTCESWTSGDCAVPGWVDPVDPSTQAPMYSTFTRYRAPIDERSNLRQLVRRQRYVTVWWVLADPAEGNASGPFLDGTLGPADRTDRQPSPSDYQRWSDTYGFQLSGARDELSVASISAG